MSRGELGKEYRHGDCIIRQGDVGNTMFVVQSGLVEVVRRDGEQETTLAELGPGDFFGEMAIFEREVRCASVRARGDACVLTVDKRTLMRRFQDDPSLGLRIIETLSHRVRLLGAEMNQIRNELSRYDSTRTRARPSRPRAQVPPEESAP